MLTVDTALKDLYKQQSTPKSLSIYFPDLGLTITNSNIVSESMELVEQICSSDDLIFGSCEASQIKFTIANIAEDLTGQRFTVTQSLGGYNMLLGTYIVDSCTKQDDRWFKDIVAYDNMKKIDVDVSAWYKALFPIGTETYNLASFRASILSYLGLVEELQTLPNDLMVITKTIDPGEISGRVVLEACEEINGAFGRIGRDGKFKHVVLQPAYGDYPTIDYPMDDYPVSEIDTTYMMPGTIAETITKSMYRNVRFEDYAVKEIDKLQIRQEENDIGAIVGTGTNAYTIEGNFLAFGKSASELAAIAQNAFGNIAKRSYRPYESNNVGLPYLEVGDMSKYDLTVPVTGYMLNRTLKGIQALQDEASAEGSQERQQSFGINKKFIQHEGRMTKIQTDVDGARVEVTNLDLQLTAELNVLADDIIAEVSRATGAEGTLSGRITVNSDSITAEVTRATGEEGFLLGQLDILAGNITLKVSASEVIAAINLSPETIKIEAANVALEGIVTANSRFKILLDGSMEATNGKFSGDITASNFTGGSININNNFTVDSNGLVKAINGEFSGKVTGSEITGSTFTRTVGATVYTKIDDAGFYQYLSDSQTFQVGYYANPGYIMANTSGLTLGGSSSARVIIGSSISLAAGNSVLIDSSGVYINGYTPITTNNIGSQSVYSLNGVVYTSINGNFRPTAGYASSISCGTSDGKFSSVWAVNGTIQTSDEREKLNIKPLEEDERFLQFAKRIVPYMYQMVDGTSGRYHTGFIAQRIEEDMEFCGISSSEFAGIIKAPVYAMKLKDEFGNDLDEYDTTSEIIDYKYNIRPDEFISLIFLWLRSL